jgi:hypothetical protein
VSSKVTVWDGVKIGCGIFIVLPAIIFGFILLLVGIPTCSAIKEQHAKEKRAKQITVKGGQHE